MNNKRSNTKNKWKCIPKSLTDKQVRFCLEYIKDFNATEAAKRAGYSKRSAYSIGQENLRKPEIKHRIELLKAEITSEIKIDIQFIIKNTIEIIERSMQHKPVLDQSGKPVIIKTPNGELASSYTFDAKAALSGLSLLAQHLPGWKATEDDDRNKENRIVIELNNYLGQPNNTYFQVTKETEHLAKLLGIDTSRNN